MRALNKKQNSDIYPSYYKIQEAKLQLRPTGIAATETMAVVCLQELLNHTASRILPLQEDLFINLPNITNAKLIVSYGFDGSTGQSMYKQRFEASEPASFDQSLFVTTVIPLKLVDNFGTVLWINQTPQSVRFCRPLKMEFVKESKEHILKEKENLDTQIKNLMPFVGEILNERKVVVSYDLHMTLIDGKVLNILTGTKSCQLCPICGAGPKQFMKNIDTSSSIFKPKPGSLQYGMSPLHAWIRIFELLLKISYRMELKKWQVRDETGKSKMKERKLNIQNKLWKEMGLHADKPKQNGSGNTNDGNTARKAFSNTKLFASILEFDLATIERLHTILIAISCEFPINAIKFKQFCEETFRLYILKYPWYSMSPTLHKILIHGSQIISSSVMPIGCLGENASEARNKFYKQDRRSHARQNSRINNMLDVFHRSIDSSDPILSSISLKKRSAHLKKKVLPKDVIELLEAPNFEIEIKNEPENKESGSDSETDSECEGVINYSLELDAEDD